MRSDDWLSDAIKKAAHEALSKSLHENTDDVGLLSEKDYMRLEHSRFIKTSITDLDMIKLHIDIALKNRDESLFMLLTRQMQEIG